MLKFRTVTMSVAIVLILALAATPIVVASRQYNEGALAARQNSVGGASASCQTPYALGYEGGALSLLFARDRPTQVADMIRSGLYTFSTVRAKDATYVVYVPSRCL
jgi:hypothetical protein